MKTKGWILTVICSMLLLVAGITFASMVLVGQPALANESLWWWILINFGVMVLLFGYGVKRGIQILRIFSIPKSKLTREPGVVVCDYNISLKKYALYKLWDIRHFSFSLLFILWSSMTTSVSLSSTAPSNGPGSMPALIRSNPPMAN